MFALCHFKDETNSFVLFDKKDIKEVTKEMNIEVEETFNIEKLEKDFSLCPLLSLNDLILRMLNKKARTVTHVLDEVGISCWAKLNNEYSKIQEKKSYLSRSQREMVISQYNLVTSM